MGSGARAPKSALEWLRSAHESVQELALACAKGQTPTPLSEFLRERFPARQRGWLGRWLCKPPNYEVMRIEPIDDGGFFRSACVFQMTVRDAFLEGAWLPLGLTYGLFALGAGGLCYLQHERDNLERLLRDEGRALDGFAPAALAALLAEALGRSKNASHDVLASPLHLREYGVGCFGGDYRINPREWDRAAPQLTAPRLSGDAEAGWQLEFCSVFGWMHDKQTLFRHRYRFSPDYRIESSQQILSRKIFARVPLVRY